MPAGMRALLVHADESRRSVMIVALTAHDPQRRLILQPPPPLAPPRKGEGKSAGCNARRKRDRPTRCKTVVERDDLSTNVYRIRPCAGGARFGRARALPPCGEGSGMGVVQDEARTFSAAKSRARTGPVPEGSRQGTHRPGRALPPSKRPAALLDAVPLAPAEEGTIDAG
jgi:hypothetical protein